MSSTTFHSYKKYIADVNHEKKAFFTLKKKIDPNKTRSPPRPRVLLTTDSFDLFLV